MSIHNAKIISTFWTLIIQLLFQRQRIDRVDRPFIEGRSTFIIGSIDSYRPSGSRKFPGSGVYHIMAISVIVKFHKINTNKIITQVMPGQHVVRKLKMAASWPF